MRYIITTSLIRGLQMSESISSVVEPVFSAWTFLLLASVTLRISVRTHTESLSKFAQEDVKTRK